MSKDTRALTPIAVAAVGLAIGVSCLYLLFGRNNNTPAPIRSDDEKISVSGFSDSSSESVLSAENIQPDDANSNHTLDIAGRRVDVSAYSGLPEAVFDRDVARVAEYFNTLTREHLRESYAFPADINSRSLQDMAFGKLDISMGEQEQVPFIMVPNLSDISASLEVPLNGSIEQLQDSGLASASMLEFDRPEGSERYRLGHQPCSAFAFVPLRNERWPVSKMPYITGSSEDVLEIEGELNKGNRLRVYDRKRAFLINQFMAVVQAESIDEQPSRSVYIAFADGRPLRDVYEGSFYLPDGDLALIPWPDSNRDDKPKPDHSIIDPVCTPELPLRSGGTVGGQTRTAFSMASFDEFGGVVYVVATSDWQPFQGRYILAGKDEITPSSDIRAVYICPSYQP